MQFVHLAEEPFFDHSPEVASTREARVKHIKAVKVAKSRRLGPGVYTADLLPPPSAGEAEVRPSPEFQSKVRRLARSPHPAERDTPAPTSYAPRTPDPAPAGGAASCFKPPIALVSQSDADLFRHACEPAPNAYQTVERRDAPGAVPVHSMFVDRSLRFGYMDTRRTEGHVAPGAYDAVVPGKHVDASHVPMFDAYSVRDVKDWQPVQDYAAAPGGHDIGPAFTRLAGPGPVAVIPSAPQASHNLPATKLGPGPAQYHTTPPHAHVSTRRRPSMCAAVLKEDVGTHRPPEKLPWYNVVEAEVKRKVRETRVRLPRPQSTDPYARPMWME
ncbi:hypothetical protein H9P43_009450 [Blastocladiella emersonii ATCC 22665]|nr:hypothetical protein H9P43_009450 [Blastocladiella emersonii ATCC 22665]